MASTATSLPKKTALWPAHQPYWVVVAMVAVNLAAFWRLLRGSYSSENYHAAPADYGSVDLAWILVSCVAAIALLIWLLRKPEECRALARAGLVATASSVIVLAKRCLGGPVQCLDPILFSTACAWTAALWLRGSKILNRPGLSRRGGFRRVDPVKLLALTVGTAAVGLLAYYMVQQMQCFNNLGLGYEDCGVAARVMYNTIHNPHELFLRVNPDKPLFFDHFQPGIVLLAPLWLLWSGVTATILLQVLSALGPALPLYWIGKHLFRDKAAALLLAMAWLVYPSTSQFIYSGSYGFRWGNLCLLLYFVALAFWIQGRHRWALAAAVWAILLKEEAAILVGMFGLYLALFERRRWQGAVIAATAFGYFLVLSSLIVPALSHQGYLVQRFFADLGATKWEIFLSPGTKPRLFWGRLLASSTPYYGALLLAPLLFVPLKKVNILFVGSLVFLFDCLAPMMLNSICYWYQASLLPVVFWAFAAALQTADTTRRRAILSGAIMAGVLLSIFFGNTFWSRSDWSALMAPGRLPVVQRMARQIDPSRSLFATPRAAAHFITQKYLYTDPSRLPTQLDYVLLDLHDPLLSDAARFFQYQVEGRPELHLVGAEDGLLLYARDGVPLDRRSLVERDTLPPDATHHELNLPAGVRVVGFRVATGASESGHNFDFVHITTFSTVTVPTDADIALQCTLEMNPGSAKTNSYASRFQFLGQGIWPIARWTPGKLYADDFSIMVPEGMATNRFAIRFHAAPLSTTN